MLFYSQTDSNVLHSDADDGVEDDLWDFGTVRNVTKQQTTISRANGPAALAAFAEEDFDTSPSTSAFPPPSSSNPAYAPARSVSGAGGPQGPRDPGTPRHHSVHSPPIHYAEQEFTQQQQAHAASQARLQQPQPSPAKPYRSGINGSGTGSMRRKDATMNSMSSGSSTLGRMAASDIVIKGELPQSPNRGGGAHGRMVSQDLSTVRGGAVVGGGGGTVGRSAKPLPPPGSDRWEDEEADGAGATEGDDVFDDPRATRRAELAPGEDEVGEELDDRTMLDSVILPIIASVCHRLL